MKADPKADAAAAAPAGSKKKLVVIAAAAVLLLGGGGGAAWYFMHGAGDAAAEHDSPKESKKKKKNKDPEAKSEYVPVEAFTVNLQPETGEQYLQVQFTLQVAGAEQATLVKDNMAIVRNRVLLLLSGKKASEISTVEGKQQLAAEIQAIVQEPFEKDGDEQEVTDVLFTSFIIQ
ncbi:flagellar basal body-associated protein FliL [Massilia sp. IC2-477]|uniref:flagellar basal body-associated protein FliL n=1 Tax=unclassified Massilia TaxID=2609279 RepID=UPI001D0FD237|nr:MULTISPECIES: flagellar basal body-associated protein FliL [unclassified Massilia]MCC2957005.1 flagellar basal body-associated protein FliL [Massilia sp. IC2-477]MCC2970814.1 flagellar basal body-associated protein FliL [Massilia sp. IC2-476]